MCFVWFSKGILPGLSLVWITQILTLENCKTLLQTREIRNINGLVEFLLSTVLKASIYVIFTNTYHQHQPTKCRFLYTLHGMLNRVICSHVTNMLMIFFNPQAQTHPTPIFREAKLQHSDPKFIPRLRPVVETWRCISQGVWVRSPTKSSLFPQGQPGEHVVGWRHFFLRSGTHSNVGKWRWFLFVLGWWWCEIDKGRLAFSKAKVYFSYWFHCTTHAMIHVWRIFTYTDGRFS